MNITYLDHNLQDLNRSLRAAFARVGELSADRARSCRWLAMEMPCPATDLSTAEWELVADLKTAAESAQEHGLEKNAVGWCMVAAQEERFGWRGEGPERNLKTSGPIIAEFLRECAPPPADLLDVASWSGKCSRPLAAQGYRISLFDPTAASLQEGWRRAEAEGAGSQIRSLFCGTFADLEKLETASFDACICLGSLLYAHPRERAEELLAHLARIASSAVIVEVASKYGLVLQLGAEFDVSAATVRQILTTGTTPAARPEQGSVVYSCFSSSEFRQAAWNAGLKVERLVGLGIADSLQPDARGPISPAEAAGIEVLLRDEESIIDAFSSLLALCSQR